MTDSTISSSHGRIDETPAIVRPSVITTPSKPISFLSKSVKIFLETVVGLGFPFIVELSIAGKLLWLGIIE